MKLKNKRTGEIKEVIIVDHGAEWELRNEYTDEDTQTYNSLAELNNEWEDYHEEPKEYWYIDYGGRIKAINDANDEEDVARKEIGNYFETEEEAEKAVEKLKAWKRLKDNGFKFDEWERDKEFSGDYIIKASDYHTCDDKDLDLLFGGEE